MIIFRSLHAGICNLRIGLLFISTHTIFPCDNFFFFFLLLSLAVAPWQRIRFLASCIHQCQCDVYVVVAGINGRFTTLPLPFNVSACLLCRKIEFMNGATAAQTTAIRYKNENVCEKCNIGHFTPEKINMFVFWTGTVLNYASKQWSQIKMKVSLHCCPCSLSEICHR